MIKKGCTIAFVLLVAVFGGYYALLRGRVESPADLILSAFGAIGLLMLVSAVKQVAFGTGDSDALKRAEQGLPLEDGRKEAVWGPIFPLGETLTAPFSGRECVAYEYDAKKPSATDSDGDSRPSGSAISGLALAPSVIRSDRGDVRLLGFSLLEKFPASHLSGDPDALARAEGYLREAPFTEMGLAKIGTMLSQLNEVMSDADGSVRQDWRLGKPGSVSLAGCDLEEKVIAPGDMVTAVGVWDASQGGLVPKHRGTTTPVTLAPGGGAAMVAYSQKRPWGLLAFSLVWSGGVHAIIYFVLKHAG